MNHETKADQNPQASWDPDPIQAQRRLEAVLFLARVPLNSRKLSQFAGLADGTQARTLVGQLNEKYNRLGNAYQIKRVASGYQMLSRPQFAKWLRQLSYVPRPTRLSRPAMETLAVVAYRQPIIKADVEAIRGVASGEMLRQLLERGWIKIFGRSEELGRPYLYVTTREFAAEFGLGNLQDLPAAQQLAGQGLPNWNNSDQISDQQKGEFDPSHQRHRGN